MLSGTQLKVAAIDVEAFGLQKRLRPDYLAQMAVHNDAETRYDVIYVISVVESRLAVLAAMKAKLMEVPQ